MKNWLKYILPALCGGVLAFLISCSFIAGKRLRGNTVCEGLEVVIKDSLENHFVSEADVRQFLDKGYGKYTGIPIDSIDLVKVEELICSRSAVLESHAYVTKDGILHIDVTQRKPVVRFQKKDGGFYADADGYIFPLQSRFASRVQIVDGNIPLAANSGYKGEISDPEEREWFNGIMNLINYMEASPELRDMIVQVHVAQNGDLVLIPREGSERFILGRPCSLDDKFRKMRKYYTAVVPEKGAGKYRTVDLRFEGQIVCR